MDRACSAGQKHRGLWWGDLIDRGHLEDPDLDDSIILKWIFHEVGRGGMYWIAVAHDRERWRALVNALLNLRVP